MAKMRLTQSFIDTIEKAQSFYGVEENSIGAICRRAVKYQKSFNFEYSACKDKTVTNPITIDVDSSLKSKELQGLVIAYIEIQTQKTLDSKRPELELDDCENYTINGD